jgi:hypothetical protein
MPVLRWWRWRPRRLVVAALIGLVVLGWAPQSEAAPTETIDCYDEGGFRDDIADIWRDFEETINVPDEKPGNPLADAIDDHDDVAMEYDPTGQPEWVNTEVTKHHECFLIKKRSPRCDPAHPGDDTPGFFPSKCWGTYPTSNYDVGYKGAENWWDVTDNYWRVVTGSLMSFAFNIATTSVAMTLWIVGWAFSFDIGDLSDFAEKTGGNYQDNLVDPFGLEDLAWFFLVVWAGVTALRGRVAAAGGEILLSILMASLAAVLIKDITSKHPVYLDSISERVEDASGAVLLAGLGEDVADDDQFDVEAALLPVQRRLHDVFVEQPYDYLNWGRPLTGECATRRDNILSVGLDLDDEWARRYMGDRDDSGPCEEEAAFNASPARSDRWIAALLHMAVAVTVLVVLGLLAMTVVIAKFAVGVLFGVAPFFALCAILPGRGRRVAWAWLGTLVQMVVAVVGMSALLSIMVIGVDEVLKATHQITLVGRFAILLSLTITVFLGRRRLLHSTQTLAAFVSESLTRVSPATAGWTGGGSAGINLAAADTAAMYGGVGLVAAGLLSGRMAQSRYVERRIAGRNLNNLKIMQQYMEQRDGLTGRMRPRWRRNPLYWGRGQRPVPALMIASRRRRAYRRGQTVRNSVP